MTATISIQKVETAEEEQKRIIMKTVIKCIGLKEPGEQGVNTAIKNYPTPWTVAKADGSIIAVVNFDMSAKHVIIDAN